GEISADARAQVDALLKQHFRPEFLNRLDEIVYYKPLVKENITMIVDLMLKDLRTRLADKQLTLEVSDKAKDFIIDHGFDPAFGARPLKRFIQSNVETLIAKKIIAADIADDKVLHVDADENGLKVS
ncbi:MAG: type VI secretion system ATPase TssH, partial [Ruminococcus sp.]|nr:type VI secretion system ATPase TssH [Ruminococcus sp.]